MEDLLKKIQKIKKEVGKITKDSENPFFKSNYTNIDSLLEQLEPLLEEEGLILLQPIRDCQVFSEIIDLETGNKISSSLILPELTDPQKTGSAITYFRRYTLTSLLALQSEDDDGNLASNKTPNKQKEEKTKGYAHDIAKSLKREPNGMATEAQVRYAKTLGIDVSEMTVAQASEQIDKVLKER